MRNPGFAADTAGWNTAGSSDGVTLSRSADGRDGAGAAVVTNTGSSAATCALNDSPNIVHTTAAGTYTATVWVRPDTPGATLKLRLREWSGDTALGQARTTVTLTTDWQPVKVRYTAVAPGASTLDFNAYLLGAPPGTCFQRRSRSAEALPALTALGCALSCGEVRCASGAVTVGWLSSPPSRLPSVLRRRCTAAPVGGRRLRARAAAHR